MPFNPAEIENKYERAFKTWKWLYENEGGFHHFDSEEVTKDLIKNYEQMEESWMKAELFDHVQTFFNNIRRKMK